MTWLWYDSFTHMYEMCYLNYMMKPYWIWQVKYDEHDSMIWNDIWHDTRQEEYEKDMNMMHSAFAYDVKGC